MKHTILCLFSVCTMLMPTPPVVAQNEIFRQNEFPTLDSLLRHENYVDGARLAEGHRNRVAKALAQSPLKPDTLPEAQVIEAFNRWTQKGRAPLLNRMRMERLTYQGQKPLHLELHDAWVSQTFLQAADIPLLRSAASPSLPLSCWLLEETDKKKGTAKLYWTDRSPNSAWDWTPPRCAGSWPNAMGPHSRPAFRPHGTRDAFSCIWTTGTIAALRCARTYTPLA